MKDLILRNLNKDEFQELFNVWKESGLPYRSKGRDRKENIEKELNNQQSHFIVAEKDKKIVGVVLVTHDGRKGWINRLAVRPEYRNRGIATRLLKEAENRLRKAGIVIFACLIEDWNKESLQYFSRKDYIKHDDIIYFTKRDYPYI